MAPQEQTVTIMEIANAHRAIKVIFCRATRADHVAREDIRTKTLFKDRAVLRSHAHAPEALLQLALLVTTMVTPSVCLATKIATSKKRQTPAKLAKQGNIKRAMRSKTNNVMITSAHAAMDKRPRGPTAPVTKATYAKAAIMATILIAPAAAL